MAGGIDWFRWHHGSVSDGKFALVAHKAGATVAEVIAVWACLLEAASAADDRGNPGAPDFEALDFSLGLADGKARRIYERMRERSLLDGTTGRIASWEKRQPKREDDTAADRKRRQREREHELRVSSIVTGRDVTPCHAMSRDATRGHDRGEESREELDTSENYHPPGGGLSEPVDNFDAATPTAYGAISREIRKAGIQANPGALDFRALVDAGATAGEFLAYASAALQKGHPWSWLLSAVAAERKRAAELSSKLHRGAMPMTGKAAESAKWVAGTSLDPARRTVIDMEASSAARILG